MHKLISLIFCLVYMLGLATASAAVFVVNVTDIDAVDANPGDGTCDIGFGTNQCTLRAAVMEANATDQVDTIVLPLNSTIVLNLTGNGLAEVGDLNILKSVVITGAILGFPNNLLSLPLIQADMNNRVFAIHGGNVVLRGLRITGGRSLVAGGMGGAVSITNSSANVLIDTVRFSDNRAVSGGAIANQGNLEIVDSDFVSNLAEEHGAAIWQQGTGSTIARRSSFRRILHSGLNRQSIWVSQFGQLELENAMIDGNPAPVSPTPTGGIGADRASLISVRNTTLAGFTDRALDLQVDSDSVVRIHNSILAQSGLSDCRIQSIAGSNPLIAISDNLIENGDCANLVGANNNLIDTDPLLPNSTTGITGSFARVRRTPFDSPAVDAGVDPAALVTHPSMLCLSHDIRNLSRPQDGDLDGNARCDMGAFEVDPAENQIFSDRFHL